MKSIRHLVISLLACCASSWAAGNAVRLAEPSPIPRDQTARFEELRTRLPPSALAKVLAIAPRLKLQLAQAPNASAEALATADVRGAFPGAAGVDIQALVFMVLMQATTDADSDLRRSMAQMQAQTKGKGNLRAIQENNANPAHPIAAAPNATNLSELSDEQSLELQMMMDSRSKLLETASNMMKNLAQTSDSTLKNIK